MSKPKPTIEELIERVESLSASCDSLREEIAALRDEVGRLAPPTVLRTGAPPSGRSASMKPPSRMSGRVPKREFREEPSPRRVKDPRRDE
jgi:hypothetical protein